MTTKQYWHALPNSEKLQCDLCPRFCHIPPGGRGACFVRGNEQGAIRLLTSNRSSGFCIDPIEKKPLNHFYPGSAVLSFGTAGCNLACKFCQNWDISKARQHDRLNEPTSAEQIAACAERYQCQGVAYTYNDPVIFMEYALEVAAACHAKGINNIAVTAGYVCEQPREAFFAAMDATNIDLKAFTDNFYHKLCGGRLGPVLDTLKYVYHETNCWLEVTTLIIPGENDSPAEIEQLSQWLANELGADVPLHFTAFHPDWKMLNHPSTRAETLIKAREIAMQNGLLHVYTGNVHDRAGDTTYCPGCGQALIERDWYELKHWRLDTTGCCIHCGHQLAGHFATQPGNWGARRLSVQP